MVKIGRSANPDKRLLSVARESGTEVSLEYKVEGEYLEKHVHEALKQHHINGEWFSCSVEEAIQTLDALSKTVKPSILVHTKEELEQLHKGRLEELVGFATSYHYLAKMLGLPSSTVQGWVNRGRISKAGAKLVEEHPALKERFTAKYLRPDL